MCIRDSQIDEVVVTGKLREVVMEGDTTRLLYTSNTALVAAATSLHFERFKLQASVLGTFVNENVASDTKMCIRDRY